MRGKIILIILLIICCIAANIRAEEIKLQPIDFSHPAVKAAVALQEAREKGDSKVLWEQLSKKTREFLSPGGFRDFQQNEQRRKIFILTSKASLAGIRVIADNRVWVEASASDLPLFKGFYFVKEKGLWKFAPIDRHLMKVSSDLDSLGSAINDYYRKNKKLPQSLNDLSGEVPTDLFSDSNAPYRYALITKTSCIVYSLGPDSKNDFGLIEYSRKEHPISSGDIIKQVVIQQ